MVRRAHRGGIRAIGSAMARFFHPGERICKRWPAEARHRVNGAVITGEGERRVGQKQQLCYLVTIPEFGDGVAFHIVKNNFRVEVAPETLLIILPPLRLIRFLPPQRMFCQTYSVALDFARKLLSFVRRE